MPTDEFDVFTHKIDTLNASQNFSDEYLSPPSALPWDYIQIGFFASMIVIGVPLNLVSLARTLQTRSTNKSWNSLQVLKIHLAITDLMILFFFALSKLIWWTTYEWLGGDLMCKMVSFFCTLAFYCNSNLIALIAIIRLMAVKSLISTGPFYPKGFNFYFTVVYGLALSFSLPQLYVWCIIYPYPDFPNWAQCVTKWGAVRWMNEENEHVSFSEEDVYELVHLLFVFWIPLAIICVSYLGVWFHLKRTITESDRCFMELQNPRTSCDTSTVQVDISVCLNSVNESTALTTIVQKNHRTRSLSVCTLLKAKNIMLKKTAYILLTYILCWSSYNILALLEYLGVSFENDHWRMLYSLIVINAVVNPLIYGL